MIVNSNVSIVVVKNRTVFDDRPQEVQELSDIIKSELAKLNGKISDLQSYQKMRTASGYAVGTNRSAEEHNSQVVMSLQSKLAEVGNTFTSILEVRSQTMKAQRERREQFSATNIMPSNMKTSN